MMETLTKRFGSEEAFFKESDSAFMLVLAIANSEHRSNNLISGIEMAEKCLPMLGEDQHKSRASCLSIIGLSKAFQHKMKEARKCLEQVVEIRRLTKDKIGEAQALNNLIVSYGLSEGDEMVEILQKSLTLYTEVSDKLGEARASNNLGIAYQRLGDNERAESLFRRSLAVKQSLGDKKGQCMSHANLGNVLQNQLRFEDALTEFKEALELSRDLTERNQIAGIQAGLALTYLGLDLTEEALRHTGKDLQVRRDIGDKFGQHHALSTRAGVLVQKNDFEGARMTCDEMDKICAESENKNQKAVSAIRRAQLYSGKKRLEFLDSQESDFKSLSPGNVFALKLLRLEASDTDASSLLETARSTVFSNESTLDIVYKGTKGTAK